MGLRRRATPTFEVEEDDGDPFRSSELDAISMRPLPPEPAFEDTSRPLHATADAPAGATNDLLTDAVGGDEKADETDPDPVTALWETDADADVRRAPRTRAVSRRRSRARAAACAALAAVALGCVVVIASLPGGRSSA